jgi:hypothetical protein
MNPHRNVSKTARACLPSPLRRVSLLSVLLGCAFALGGAAAPAFAEETAQAAETAQWVPGRILVQPKPGLPASELEKILKSHGGKSVGKIEAIDVHIVQLPGNASEKAVAALLAKNPHLKFAELDMILKSESTANDPYFANAWHLPKIGAPTAWDSSTGNGIIVAILDSGVDAAHPDLAGKMVTGWNFYDNNSNTADVYGHGTKVAGSAAAASNNALGVASVAGTAKIMPIRVTDTSGAGYLSKMASGITYAADHGARVANLSFEAAGSYSTVQSAAQYMKNKGGLVLTAAGNTGAENTSAPSDTNIVVAATGSTDVRASWSTYGNFVDVAGPGVGIWTTTKGGGYASVNGTSFASPVTAGVVALMMAANPSLGSSQVQSLLYSTAQDLGTAGWDKYYGYGRVNAAAAVQAAKAAATSDTAAPIVNLTSPTSGATVKGLVTVGVSASDNVGVSRVDLVVNNTKLASDTTAPYGFSWDSTKVADGNATLIAYAYDAAGNYTSSSVTVKVSNTADTIAPSAAISNPAANAKVNGSITIQGSGSDNVAVASLNLYIDGVLKGSASGSSLSYSWNTSQVAAGTHTLRLDAKDAAGNLGSRSIQVMK